MDKTETLAQSDLLRLGRYNTPSVYNGLEQIYKNDLKAIHNREESRDFMPWMGPMVGRAVTVVIQPGNQKHQKDNPQAMAQYREYVAKFPGPKIVVVQDLDKPDTWGAFWGEVNSTFHRSVGCLGTITDGAIRDLDEMSQAGFKALARRLCVGHAFATAVKWDCEVEVFGTKVRPGDLIHADKHGFLVIPTESFSGILEATQFMDSNECRTVIPAARNFPGKSTEEFLGQMRAAGLNFGAEAKRTFSKNGEWG